MAEGGSTAAATGATAPDGVAVVASDDGSEAGAGEATGRVGARRSPFGAALAGGSAAKCHRPSCQEENASVTANAPSASPPKSSCVFTSGPAGKRQRVADNHDNLMRRLEALVHRCAPAGVLQLKPRRSFEARIPG
jgi:hypothetical protein